MKGFPNTNDHKLRISISICTSDTHGLYDYSGPKNQLINSFLTSGGEILPDGINTLIL